MKTASAGVANPEHPLVVRFQDFCEVLTKTAETRAARAEVGEHLDRMGTFLKSAAAADIARAGKDIVGKAWGASKALSQEAAPVIGGAIRGAGKAAGDVAEAVTPWTPEIVAALALNEARKSPTGQRALSYVPGTQQNKIRKYYAARRG